MKSSIKTAYLLGIFLGVSLSILAYLIFGGTNQVDLPNDNNQNKQEEVSKLMDENQSLKTQVVQKEEEIQLLNEKLEGKSSTSTTVENKKVILDIKSDMTNSQIADLLIENGIYPHKNDLLMLLEMLKFNRFEYAKAMQEGGYLSNAQSFSDLLKEIETNQYAISDYLKNKKLVQDSGSFMKIIYLLDINNGIKYGKKEFDTNSSLRHISDILINE